MKSIIDYGHAASEMQLSRGWADLIGKEGHQGPGKIVDVSAKPVLHYQPIHGAKNYHDCPHTLARYINQVILEQMPEIVTKALELQQTDLKAFAKAAAEDCQKILARAEAA